MAGRQISVDNAGTNGVPNVIFNYQYNEVDYLTNVTDTIDGVTSGVETFSYDALNRLTTITQSGNGVTDKRVDMAYDAANQMSSVTRYSDLNGTNKVAETNYTYDLDSRLTDLNHTKDGITLASYALGYDAGDRITSFTTLDGVSTYNYDDSNQLLDANHSYQEDENYTYDDNGNRTNEGYVTGDDNRLLSDGTYNYEYDGEGNRTKRTEIATGEVTEYEWDYRNRLVGVVTNDNSGNVIKRVEYIYDVANRRIGKSVDSDGDGAAVAEVERYVLDGEHIALVFDGEGNQTERFLHGNQIDWILAQENSDGTILWGLNDHQGSVRDVIDSDGVVLNHISYDSFGLIRSETHGNVNFRFGYTGRELDEETGLQYNRARYYDPAVGRFISEDPLGFAAGDRNIYRYVGNNPMFYIDPSGLCGVGFGNNGSGGASRGNGGNPSPNPNGSGGSFGNGFGDGDGSEFSFTELGVNLGGGLGGRPKQYTQTLGDSGVDNLEIQIAGFGGTLDNKGEGFSLLDLLVGGGKLLGDLGKGFLDFSISIAEGLSQAEIEQFKQDLNIEELTNFDNISFIPPQVFDPNRINDPELDISDFDFIPGFPDLNIDPKDNNPKPIPTDNDDDLDELTQPIPGFEKLVEWLDSQFFESSKDSSYDNYGVPSKPIGDLGKPLNDKWLKKRRVDPHLVKEILPGPAKHFDIYKDDDGNLWGLRKPKFVKDTTPEYLGNLRDFQE